MTEIWVKLFKNGPSKICLGRPYHFNFFKGCLPQILLGLFLNTVTHILMKNMLIMFTALEMKQSRKWAFFAVP